MRMFFRKHSILICFTIFYVIYILFDWMKFDILTKLQTPLMRGQLVSLLSITILVFAGIFAIVFVLSNVRKNPFKAVVPILLLIFIIMTQVSFKYTDWYAKLNYNLFINSRNDVVQLFSEGKISKINSDKYLIPMEYRFTSKTGWIHKYDDSDEIRFYIQLGRQASKIIYIKDSDVLPKEHYLEKFVTTRKLDEHWYWVLSR